MQIEQYRFNFTNVVGKLVIFRNGERLKVTDYKHFPETKYGLCHALSFGTVGRYMLFTQYGTKSLNKTGDLDIVDIWESDYE